MVIPLPYSQTSSTKGLVGYKSTEKLTRWFCETCGARCWQDDRTGGDHESQWEYEIPVGIVDRVEADGQLRTKGLSGLLDRVQMWVEDAEDGGGAIFVNGGELAGMDRRLTGRQSRIVTDEVLHDIVAKARAAQATEEVEGRLHAACHCKLVQFTMNKDETGRKYEAGLDACESCRKVSGSEITVWITEDMDRITLGPDNKPLDLASSCFGKYSTSPGVDRYFCSKCGATIFYRAHDRGNKIDISVGTIRTPKYARAEAYLDWIERYGDGRVAYVEDAVDPDFVAGLVRGCTNYKASVS